MNEFPLSLNDLLTALEQRAGALETPGAWPREQLELLTRARVAGWVIPAEYGGSDISALELMRGYEQLGQVCLTTTFVLTQRNGACERIASSDNEGLKAEILPALCRGELFATVGISHLTTSRQHWKQPAVSAELSDHEIILNGNIPWVTGSTFADLIVTGGSCADGRQILIALPTKLPGVEVLPPPALLALNASQTGAVELRQVKVPRERLLAGPVEGVMKRGQGGGAGSLTTSALASGLAAGAAQRLAREAEQRADLREIVASLDQEQRRLSADLATASVTPTETLNAETIRQRANSLALRSTQAYLAACKGAGFVSGHPAERLAREAMFFLVWSCPQPVLQATLREFACLLGD